MNPVEQSKLYWQEVKHQCDVFDLSIIIPAYNEEKRLAKTLEDLNKYFLAQGLNYQVIVVNDGSNDQTIQVAEGFREVITNFELINFTENQGKGAAVKAGVLASRANLILFCDADGATPFAEFEKLNNQIKQGKDIAIASRAIPKSNTELQAVWLRKVMGRTFNFFVNKFLIRKFYDTQCGFKLFTAESGHTLFYLQSRKGFSFDLEILYLAQKLKFSVSETAVNWTNISGSKVNIFSDSVKMFIDIFRIHSYWSDTKFD